MDMSDDGSWYEDDTLRADKIFIGMSRHRDTKRSEGVVIALTVNSSPPVQISAVLTAEQGVSVADAIKAAALDVELTGMTTPND